MRTRTLTVVSGTTVNYQQRLHPDMLTRKGLVTNSAMPNLKVRYTKEYALDKIKYEVIDALGIKSKEDAIKLLDKIFTNS